MKKISKLLLLCMLMFSISGCNISVKEPISKTGFYFDTVISITLYDTDDSTLLDQCFSYCQDLEQTVSRTISTSEISQINHANGQPVVVSDMTVSLLKQGIRYSKLTDGAFDITIAPVSTLWDFKNNTGQIPTREDIADVLSHVSYKNIVIEGNTVTLTDPECAIDLGGIAKGYMADKLKDFLIKKGVKSALIDLGGNILTIGSKPDGSPFHIGIKKPFNTQEIITSVTATDTSVVTSGSYERYFELDGKIYHHILDTNTGYPVQNGLLSVTILSEESVDGDALSTACFALGLEQGRELIDSMDGVEAIFITEDYEIIDTRN